MIEPSQRLPASLSVDEYLERERDARDRGSRVGFEYVAGETYAMSPASPRHDTIVFNIRNHLQHAVRRAACHMFGDVLTRVGDDRYYYPDVVITCAPLGDEIVVAPCFVVEVTSPATRATDLREKPPAYRDCRSVRGFLIVEQRRRLVTLHTRQPDASWSKVEFSGHGTLTIPCVDAPLTLDQIYETLEFPTHVREGDEFTPAEYSRAWVLVRAERVS